MIAGDNLIKLRARSDRGSRHVRTYYSRRWLLSNLCIHWKNRGGVPAAEPVPDSLRWHSEGWLLTDGAQAASGDVCDRLCSNSVR